MKREIITISDSGTVAVPSEVKMNIYEIANLCGIYYQTAKAAVRSIEKSGVSCGDFSAGGTVEGLKVYPDYYGLGMVVAVAFQVHSPQAEIFRRWVMKRLLSQQPRQQPMFIQLSNSKTGERFPN